MVAHNFPLTEELINDIRQSTGHFEPNPHMQLGETDSGHGVVFGEVPALGQVAVKPFSKPNKAMVEERNLHGVEAKGFDALEPLGVVAGGLATYLITQRRSGLRTLGQTNWSADVASRRISKTIIPALNQAATTAAEWHNSNIIHGDMQAKNMAYDREGQSVFIDAEKTEIDSSSAEHRTFRVHKDLVLLGYSVLRQGLLSDRSPRYRAGFLESNFLEPYINLVKPENFALDAETRQKATAKWWLDNMQKKGHRLPKFEIPGLDLHGY